ERDRARRRAADRYARGLSPRAPALPRSQRGAYPDRAPAGSAACGGGDRASRRFRPIRPARRRARHARRPDPIHPGGGRPRCALRREPVLLPWRHRRVRGRRRDARVCGTHARRGSRARLRTRCAATCSRRARRRFCACTRPRARRVRRDDHLCRQPAGCDADAPARGLRTVRTGLRHRSCDQRAVHRRRCTPSRHPEALRMASVRLDLSLPLRAFDLELALEAGPETVALVGPSGAGKTSVLRAIAGLARPARGTISCGDEIWFDADRRIDRRPEERSVGFVFQEYALFPHLNVEQNVTFGGARADRLLWRLHIEHLAKAKPSELSGGERQRVALARALARGPKVLLLDEPMAALDPHTRGKVRAELHDLLRELALPALLVTHDFEDAAALAD